MKNRKLAIVAFFLVAVLCIGAGYAAVTDLLDIQGTAEVTQQVAQSAFDQNVYFSETVVVPAGGNTASRNADNNDKASFSANSLKNKGDELTFTFTFMNDNSDLDASVKPEIKSQTNEEYFEISSDWAGETKIVPANSSLDYSVTVKLKKQPADLIGGSFGIEFIATAVEKAVTP